MSLKVSTDLQIISRAISAEVSISARDSVRFDEDVQPLLRRHCLRCHGEKVQEADLQLNLRAAVFGIEGRSRVVVEPGNAEQSLLIRRLTDPSEGDLMPPDGQPLSKAEIEILRQWIDQGAAWPDDLAEGGHWAYVPPKRPQLSWELSTTRDNPIDLFIDRRLARAELTCNGPTSRERWIRRVSLVLTGIPPTSQQVTAFLRDTSDAAREKVVDRLLASQAYGERWAVSWMDLARYADSNGYQADQLRDNWAYRDWIIRAFNRDMPFDQFVIEQLAGDLLPDATLDQQIATGFHRMTTVNVEAGVSPEADRVNQIVDRVNTTGTVFLGTSLECAQCHDHKYDPFTQEDYYRIFAYFNNTPMEVQQTSGVTYDFYGPTMDLPLEPSQRAQREELLEKRTQLTAQREKRSQLLNEEYAQWLASLSSATGTADGWKPLVPTSFSTSGGEEYEIQPDGSVLLSGSVPDTVDHTFEFANLPEMPTAVRIELLTDPRIPGTGPGRGDEQRSNVILSELICEIVRADGQIQKISLGSPRADFSQTKWDVKQAIDGDRKTGWAISPEFGKPHWASFVLNNRPQLDQADRIRVRLGQYYGRGRIAGKPRVSFFYGDTSQLNADAATIKLARKAKPTEKDKLQLRQAFEADDPELKALDQRLQQVEEQLVVLQPNTTLVMVEMPQERETHVLVRGDYEQPAARVRPGVPATFAQATNLESTGNRLELARWLTSAQNPLLARVTVNRWWAEIFGTGLVTTPEDFGTQADYPSHPQLLDWLACELIDSGWSMKHMLRLMVLSAAFERDASMTSELLQRDPQNRLLARGPRFRMPVEMIRDNALAISGLLSSRMFGPPVMPFQPDNIWRSVGRNQPEWKTAQSEERFRRGVYVVWKRAAPYPSFTNLDAPDRGSCTVRRNRTNTPLQALTLLNDPAYAEMCLAFADLILSEGGDTDVERLNYALRRCLARSATEQEMRALTTLLEQERQTLRHQPETADQRSKNALPSLQFRSGDSVERAAWFSIANVLLNLDETINY